MPRARAERRNKLAGACIAVSMVSGGGLARTEKSARPRCPSDARPPNRPETRPRELINLAAGVRAAINIVSARSQPQSLSRSAVREARPQRVKGSPAHSRAVDSTQGDRPKSARELSRSDQSDGGEIAQAMPSRLSKGLTISSAGAGEGCRQWQRHRERRLACSGRSGDDATGCAPSSELCRRVSAQDERREAQNAVDDFRPLGRTWGADPTPSESRDDPDHTRHRARPRRRASSRRLTRPLDAQRRGHASSLSGRFDCVSGWQMERAGR